VERLIAAGVLAAAFIVMASIFDPGATRAGVPGDSSALPGERPLPAPIRNSSVAASTNPHEGLAPLGELTSSFYRVCIYSAPGGPRYTVYDAASGRELGTLLSSQQVQQLFDIPVATLDFSAGQSISDADDSAWDDFP